MYVILYIMGDASRLSAGSGCQLPYWDRTLESRSGWGRSAAEHQSVCCAISNRPRIGSCELSSNRGAARSAPQYLGHQRFQPKTCRRLHCSDNAAARGALLLLLCPLGCKASAASHLLLLLLKQVAALSTLIFFVCFVYVATSLHACFCSLISACELRLQCSTVPLAFFGRHHRLALTYCTFLASEQQPF